MRENPGPSDDAPVVVLVEPQLGENIGSAARAMLNCGVTDLRIVSPREPWPNPAARAAASGADPVLEAAQLYDSRPRAVEDVVHLYATTGRDRDMVKPMLTPRQAASEMRALTASGERCAVLFGPERTGLRNEDLNSAKAIVSAPLNPEFSSLNLAQAVLLVCYEWWLAADGDLETGRFDRGSRRATQEELENLFGRLESGLDRAGFLRPIEKRPLMVQNLRNIFARADLTEQEVRTLHGVITYLSRLGDDPREA